MTYDMQNPMTIFDIDPVEEYERPAQAYREFARECQERLAYYDALEKAIRDEERRTKPSWWRRTLRSTVWTSWWCCCGLCCMGQLCGDHYCLDYSERRHAVKVLGAKIWDVLYGKIWTGGLSGLGVNLRAGYLALKMMSNC